METKNRTHLPYLEERNAFKLLLLSNPNFFGTLEDSPLSPILPLCCDTSYEELVDAGYHPQQRQLEAVVHLFQPQGYGSDVCGPGTPEYVRFYLSFDGGATWQDQGLTSFQAYNIPEGTKGRKHLEYAVSLPINPPAKFCFVSPLAQMRAILSWNAPPPANMPNWKPPWGNVREVTIQIEPYRIIKWPDLLKITELKLPWQIEKVLDPEAPILLKKTAPSLLELAETYQEEDVPIHRFAFKQLMQVMDEPLNIDEALATPDWLEGLTIDPDIIKLLKPVGDGDTSYEELTSIGLDPNLPNMMVGVIRIKRPSGFSGPLCSHGSKEYVTFWADADNNGSFETCLGTADVTVYDLGDIPPEGVYYAVRLPVDLSNLRQHCKEGARVVRIRAILSWNVPVSCANPDQTPRWGNREETLIAVTPHFEAPAGKIAILGGIATSFIDNALGVTKAGSVFAMNNLPVPTGSAFGGRVTANGYPVLGHSYIVEASNDGVVWEPALAKLRVTDANGIVSDHKPNPVTHRFDYLPTSKNLLNLLAHWDTHGNDLWQVRLTVYNGPASSLTAVPIGAPDIHKVQLDNTGPEAKIKITSGAGNCGKFAIGTTIKGKFVARDDRLLKYSLHVAPGINTPPTGVPTPHQGTANTAPDPGDNWELKTAGMKPCGYIMHLEVWDRVVVNSQRVGHRTPASVGFCLEDKTNKASKK